jgi:hypothetical protein
VVHVHRDSEYVKVTIHWAGGHLSHHEVIRPVKTYDQLRDVVQLRPRVVALRAGGHTMAQIAATLDAEGVVPPKRCGPFSKELVRQLLVQQGLGDERRDPQMLGPAEWWLSELACTLEMPRTKRRDWAVHGWLHARQSPAQGLWIVWADADEIAHLRQLVADSRRGANSYAVAYTTLKPRPDHASDSRG